MCLLIETIKIHNKKIENLEFHLERINKARKDIFKLKPLENLIIPLPPSLGTYKCRIIYGPEIISINLEKYKKRKINSLKVVYDDDIVYDYKWKDRKKLENLFNLKNGCDEILIVKKGFITDTSFSNVVLKNSDGLFTPLYPLLKGIKRESLLKKGIIQPREIKIEDLKSFEEIHLINAMLDLNDCVINTTKIFL